MSHETMLLSIAHISCLQHRKHTADAPEHPRVAGHVQVRAWERSQDLIAERGCGAFQLHIGDCKSQSV